MNNLRLMSYKYDITEGQFESLPCPSGTSYKDATVELV